LSIDRPCWLVGLNFNPQTQTFKFEKSHEERDVL